MPVRRTLAIAFAAAGGAVALTLTSLSSITAAAAPNLAITPASFSVTADGNVTYTATTTDNLGNSLDVTAGTTFSISPDGSCSGRFCGSTVSGPHTVMATYQGAAATASLTVTPGQATTLVLSPASATIVAGGSQGYTSVAYDRYGNSFGDVTASTTFYVDSTVNPPCAGNTCSTTNAGPHQVVGEWNTIAGASPLTVTGGPVDRITLSPVTTTIQAGSNMTYAVEAFDQYGNDLGSVTAATTFSISPDGSCSAASCTATVAGPHTVTGTDSSATATASLAVTVGPLASLSISPASATISAGGSQTYTATGTDQYGNSLGDLTSRTTLTITPADGSCSQASCTATVASPHTVFGASNGNMATATLAVSAGPLDHITLSSNVSSIQAGGANYYTVTEFDQYGNQPTYPGPTFLSISPDGSCTAYSCTATVAGVHTVTATDTGKTATATLTVTPGPVGALTIASALTTIVAGGSATYTAAAADQYGNSIGDVTAATTFSLAPDGSCNGASCTATKAGTHTVTGTDNGKSGTATLGVTAAGFDHISLAPATSTIMAGGSQAYATRAFDVYGNDLGDQTAASALSIAPDGACATGSCSATHEGSHTVTATYSGKIATASLWVNPSQVVASIGLNPGTQNVPAGYGATWYIVTIDQYGNAIAVLTSGFSLTIGPPTTACAGSTCSATKVGTYTITATYQGFTSTGQLVVRPAALDHITLTPATATIVAGGTQAYAVEGFDQYGNDIGSMASSTSLTVSGYSCSNMSCQAFTAGNLTVVATSGGKTATAILTVTPGPITRLTVSPTSVTLPAQASQAFTAAGTDAYSNAVNVSGATWSLASHTPGTVSSTIGTTTTFKASNSSTGTGSITATLSGLSASAAITVVPVTPSISANVKPTKVDLTWKTAAGAHTYTVYRGTTSSNLVALESGLTSTSFTDTPGSGIFYYYVVAVGSTGQQSAPSNIVSATFK